MKMFADCFGFFLKLFIWNFTLRFLEWGWGADPVRGLEQEQQEETGQKHETKGVASNVVRVSGRRRFHKNTVLGLEETVFGKSVFGHLFGQSNFGQTQFWPIRFLPKIMFQWFHKDNIKQKNQENKELKQKHGK